jgi:hypothetical protein
MLGHANPAEDQPGKLLTALRHERRRPGGRGTRPCRRGGRLTSADRKAIRAHREAHGA